MNHDQNKRQVPVTYRNSGETRMSAPVPVQAPRHEADAPASAWPDTADPTASVPDAHSVDAHTAGSVMSAVSDEVHGQLRDEAGVLVGETSAPEAATTRGGESQASGASKVKPVIETLEQFITSAYGRKGKRIKLEAKIEKQIGQNPILDDAAMNRLLALAAEDTLLAVPRQLLLVSRDIDGFPTLRAALASFISTLMLGHPVFAAAGLQGALRNLPDALSPADALEAVWGFSPKAVDGKDPMKGSELQGLRRNAANLFVTWLATNRGMGTDELVELLFRVVWRPAARELNDDNARLRALTEWDQTAGVGLACVRFHLQAQEDRVSKEHALREINDVRMRLAATDAQRHQAEQQRDALQVELEALRAQTAAEIAELKRRHADERTHLHHGQEQLGGRLLHRLDDAVETLEVGLSALRNKTPRVEVMLERAELVVDSLRAEIKNLREE